MARYDTTSLTLLDRVRDRDEVAWERLVELYAPLVRHWCRRSDLGPEDTADVFQEVFRAVAEKVEGFRRDRDGDTFRGWLRTITRNKVRDLFRRRAERPRARGGTDAQLRIEATPDPLVEDDEESSVMQQSLHAALRWVRGDFEERTWTAFWQCQVENRPTDEIATELDMTPAAVRKAKYRVLQRLREELAGLVDDDVG